MTTAVEAPAGWHEWLSALCDRLSSAPLGADGVRSKAALVLVDDLAAMVAASGHAETLALTAKLGRTNGSLEATVVVSGRAAREHAAAANAVAAAWDELDEGYRPATCHGGLYTLPAAMAEAESAGQSLDQLLEALVVGYEVVTSLARAFPAPRPMRLHPHATLSPVGAAAAVTWLRTGDPRAVLTAADVAVTLSMAGPFRHATAGLQSRNVWAGAGALSGFFAADCAAAGLQADSCAPVEVLAGAHGHAISAEELASRPASWAILDGYHKPYAACQYTHSALEASADLVNGPLQGPAPEVREVLVETHPLALALDDRAPRTALGGKFSVPHVVASVLATGSTDPSVFEASGLTDPAVGALRERVRLASYEPLPAAPHDRPARVTVTTIDGAVFSSTCRSALGGPDRPLGTEQVLDKVRGLTEARIPGFVDRASALVSGATDGDASWAATLRDLLGR